LLPVVNVLYDHYRRLVGAVVADASVSDASGVDREAQQQTGERRQP
jgi:hypothetical protein